MSEEGIKINKNTLYFVGMLMLIVVAGNFLLQSDESNVVEKNVIQGDYQEVVVGMKDYNYYPNTIKIKAGVPVRMRLDDSVYGCFRDLTIREFGVREYLINPDDYVEFVPDRPGNYKFACSMGMGYGTLIVE